MSSEKQIVKGVYWTTIVNIVNAVYNFISVPLLIAYFGKAHYGLIGLAMSVNIYLRLLDIGFNSTNVRFFSNWLAKDDTKSVRSLFQTSLSIHLIIGFINAAVLLLLAYFSGSVFHLQGDEDKIMKNLLYILSISAFINWICACYEQLVRAFEHIGWLQKMMLLPKVLQIAVLIITLCVPGTSIELYYALTTLSLIVLLPPLTIHIKKYAPYISFIPSFDKDIFKQILPYCINIFSFGIFQFSINYLRPVFLGMQGTLESVTDYRVLNAIITLVLLIGGSFLSVVLPASSKAVAIDNKEAQERLTYTGTKYITIILSFMVFGIMSVSAQVLTIYAGSGYEYLVFWLDLWLLTTLISHNQAISSLILSHRDIRAITIISMISSTIGLILCWVLIPKYQVGGTVIAYMVYGLIQTLFYYLYYWPRKMHINSWRVFTYSFLPTVAAGIASMLVVRIALSLWLINMNIYIQAIAGTAGFMTIFVLLHYFLILSKEDKLTLLKYTKSIFKIK